MKKLFTIWAVMLSVLFTVGCTENSQTDQPNNGNNTENPGDNNGGNNENNGTTDEPTQPVISIDEVEVTADSFTFEVTTNVPGVLGYTVVAEGFSAPKMDEWFAANSKEIEGTENITISNLNDGTYTVRVVDNHNCQPDLPTISLTGNDEEHSVTAMGVGLHPAKV